MSRHKQVLIEAQDCKEHFFRARNRKHTLENLLAVLQEQFPSHNIRLLQDCNNPHIGKITLDGYELHKGMFK